MKFRSLMTAICVLATANIVSAAPFAYVANSGTKNVSVIDTADNSIKATVALPDTGSFPPYAYSVTVGASGQYVYVGLQTTNEVIVIDAATNTVVKRIGLGGDQPGGLAVNTAETRLYVASNKSNTLIVINVAGTSAVEVGRVTVDDSALSAPEGVVLSPDGTKAYVANALKGTVAEISLDEATNIYTRTNLISLGGNSSPYGLAITSDGSKLYVAGGGGTASLINTATRAVTDIVAGSGNSISIASNNSKIYAPSMNDAMYTIDGSSNAVSGPYAVTGWPWGSSVVPDNAAKLYLAMFNDSQVKVFNPGTNVVDATITLPSGAKPISFGNFIGPVFPYTITSSNGANCNILPLGTIPVNSYGRSFSIVPTSGNCEVKVDGTSVGQPSVYNFSAVTAGHTIDASQIAGTFFTLSGDWISSVGGYLVSTAAGISQHSKSAKFLSGSTVTLKAGGTGFQVKSGTWTGACAGTSGDTCTITMDADKTFGTTTVVEVLNEVPSGPIYNVTKNAYYQTLAEATGAAATADEIKISTDYTAGGLTTSATAGVQVKLSSQWKAPGYTAPDPTYRSPGAITITNVAILADGLVI